MARFKVPGRRGRKPKQKNNKKKNEDFEPGGEQKEDESEPMLLPFDQYMSLFGDTDEEEDSFQGFVVADKQGQTEHVQNIKKDIKTLETDGEEEQESLKPEEDNVDNNIDVKNNNEKSKTLKEDIKIGNYTSKRAVKKINYRHSLHGKFSFTDDNNPYKKTYLSYGNRNRRASLPLAPVNLKNKMPLGEVVVVNENATSKQCNTNVKFKKYDQSFSISNHVKNHQKSPLEIPKILKISTAKTTAAKVILNKAHKVKQQKSVVVATPMKLSIKVEENTCRPRRKPKSTFSSDFVYEIGSRKSSKRTFDDIKTPPQSPVPIKKEDVSNDLQQEPNKTSYEQIVSVKQEPKDFDYTRDLASNDFSTAKKKKVRIKYATTPGKKKVKIKNSSPEKGANKVSTKFDLSNDLASFSNINQDYVDNEEQVDKNFFATSKKEKIETNYDKNYEIRKLEEPASKTKIYLRLKVVKINEKLEFVDFNNRIVKFCKECERCRRTEDCGKCGHCRSYCKTVRFLPCWERRCIYPTYGKIIEVSKPKTSNSEKIIGENRMKPKSSEKSSKDIKQKQYKVKEIPNNKKEHEEVELSFVNDNQLNKTNSILNVSEPLEFKVSLQKGKKEVKKHLTSPTGRSSVFTGLSPIKPKLRSTMNELAKKPSDFEMKLPKVYYGPETLVKLPWPNDEHEDAAWLAGHHLCFTSNVCFGFHSLCFLCGSGGREKMVTCQFCCEVFHSYCLDVEPMDKMKWSCDRCKRCTVCGFKENLLMCDKCHDCYHAECLGPFYQRDTEGVEETWVCGKCVKCGKCGRRTAGKTKTSRWMCNFSMCEDCGTNWLHKNYCPVCKVIYQDDDDSLKMMLCSHCERWIHMECEGIAGDDYEILADLPDSIPYICKLCSGNDKSQTVWYKEVKYEMNSGFLKVYYDLLSNRDFKQFRKTLTNQEEVSVVVCLQSFKEIFNNIENQAFKSVKEFHTSAIKALQGMKAAVNQVNTFDISLGIFPDVLVFFTKCIKTIFPWYCSDEEGEKELKFANKEIIEETMQNVDHVYDKENILETNNSEETATTLTEESVNEINPEELQYLSKSSGRVWDTHDHCYVKTEEKECENLLQEFENVVKLEKDERKCLFCSKCGDSEEFAAGRLLYSGMDEWVHINCALWSAEVYEDDCGRLKHVYDAVKRGSKLKCDACGSWGASIGCCVMKCSRSYHFVCAMENDVVFQDDKKIYCADHSNKANKSLILTTKELSVPRRVIVDLVRFKSTKKIQRGINPNSIKLLCGGFRLEALGSLSEKSDQKHALIPIGYRVTRIFWSTQNSRRRCKYTCEVQVIKTNKDVLKSELQDSILEKDVFNCTYCHDKGEWEKLLQKTECSCDVNTLQSVGSVKRKLYPGPCTKCLTNLKYCFTEDQNIKPITLPEPVKKVEKTQEDHNFFPLEKKSKKDKTKHKIKVKIRTAMMGAAENETTIYTAAAKNDELILTSTDDTKGSGSVATTQHATFSVTSSASTTFSTSMATPAATTSLTTQNKLLQQGYSSFEQYKLYRKLLENPLSVFNNTTKYTTPCIKPTAPKFTTVSSLTSNNVVFNSAGKYFDKALLTEKSVVVAANSTSKQKRNKQKQKVQNRKSKQTSSSSKSPVTQLEGQKSNLMLLNSNVLKRYVNAIQPELNKIATVLSPIQGKCSPYQCTTGLPQQTINGDVPITSLLCNSTSLLQRCGKGVQKRQQTQPSSCKEEITLLDASKLFNVLSPVRNNVNPSHCILPPLVPKTSMNILPDVSNQLQNSLNNNMINPVFSKLYTNQQQTTNNKTQPLLLPSTTFRQLAPSTSTLIYATSATPLQTTLGLAISEHSSQVISSQSTCNKKSTLETNQSQEILSQPPMVKPVSTVYVQPPAVLNAFHALKVSSVDHIKENINVINSNKIPKRKSGYQEIRPKPAAIKPTMCLLPGYPVLAAAAASPSYHVVGQKVPIVPKQQFNSMHQIAVVQPQPITILPLPSSQVIATSQQEMSAPLLVSSQQKVRPFASTNPTTSTMLNISCPHGDNKQKVLLLQSFPAKNNQDSVKNYTQSHTPEPTTRIQQPGIGKPSRDTHTTTCIESLINSLVENSPPETAKSSTAGFNFKQEILLRQLKEYLKKNPDVVNFVENPRSQQLGAVPVVNLTNSVQSENHVYYSAFLPEHLWAGLVKSGIAQRDINKIFKDSSQNGLIQPDTFLAQPNLGISVVPSSNQSDIFEASTSSVSLISSIKNLHDARMKQQHQQQQRPRNKLSVTPLQNPFQFETSSSMMLSSRGNPILSPSKCHPDLDHHRNPNADFPVTSAAMFIQSKENNISPRKLLLRQSIPPTKDDGLMHTLETKLLSHNGHLPSPYFETNSSSVSLHHNSPSLLKRKKRIKMASDASANDREKLTSSVNIQNNQCENLVKNNVNKTHTGPIPSKRKQQSSADLMNTEIDVCTFDMNIGSDEFIENNVVGKTVKNLLGNEPIKKSAKRESSKQRRDYGAMLNAFLFEEKSRQLKSTETQLNFVISNEDGWKAESCSLREIWKKLIGRLNEGRYEQKMPCFSTDVTDAYDFLGLSKEFVAYLVEQLPGGHKCRKYKFQHHLPCIGDDDDEDLPENASGCARTEVVKQTAERDMFAWLSSMYRKPPNQNFDVNTEDEILGGGQELPTAMKYRFLKNTAKDHVGVYRSGIQGRGLFCKKNIETGDMIIEYSGQKIRSVLTDKREDYYEKKGYGCYMFRIDQMSVVDATMKGNSARFINHSCDPNCYSRIISVDGCKKIVIFAIRRITVGEELTYDYKFAQEDDKLPCYCGSKKCRKYLN